MKRLRALTIVAPIAYLILIEVFSLLVLVPVLGRHNDLRLLVVFLLLIAGAVPFSLWVFATIERQQRRLAESAAVLDSVEDYGIFMLDPRGNIRTWNSGAELIKGYKAEEIIGRHISRFYLPEEVAAGRPAHNLQVAATEGRFEGQGWRVRKDGSRFWAEVVSTALRDDTGRLTGYTHVVRDFTSQREAEESIRRLNEELEQHIAELGRANDEVMRRNRQLAAINRAIISVSGALELEEVLQNIVDAARELVQSRYGALGVAGDDGHMVQFMTSGISPEERAAIGPFPQGHGLLGVLIAEGKPLRISDIAADPRSHGFPPHHPPMTSLLGVPILFQGKAVGDLYLADKIGDAAADPLPFTQEDQELLVLLAGHAAVAIQNARLYDEARVARDRLQTWNQVLEEKVAERTAEIARYSQTLTIRVLQAQEEERKRIARELHDETAQSLSTLLINLDLLEPLVDNVGDDVGDVLRTRFQRIRDLAKRTLDETRALSHALRPTILDDFGLIAALRWFADEFTQTFGIPLEVTIEGAPPERLSPELELALFRIAQEALTNSGKYADADRACLALSFRGSVAHLVIEDDGKGFDPDAVAGPTRQGGLGLYGMRERATLVGATLGLEAAPGRGTRVTVDAPLVPADTSPQE